MGASEEQGKGEETLKGFKHGNEEGIDAHVLQRKTGGARLGRFDPQKVTDVKPSSGVTRLEGLRAAPSSLWEGWAGTAKSPGTCDPGCWLEAGREEAGPEAQV